MSPEFHPRAALSLRRWYDMSRSKYGERFVLLLNELDNSLISVSRVLVIYQGHQGSAPVNAFCLRYLSCASFLRWIRIKQWFPRFIKGFGTKALCKPLWEVLCNLVSLNSEFLFLSSSPHTRPYTSLAPVCVPKWRETNMNFMRSQTPPVCGVRPRVLIWRN